MDPLTSLASRPGWRGVPRPARDSLLVSEVFGPTIQGEGPSAGRAAAFVRLGMCNLKCTWCDSGYTWDSVRHDLSSELTLLQTAEVFELVVAMKPKLVVVTGGEPALQARELAVLTARLRSAGREVHLETNGTVELGPLADNLDFVVVSPKLSNSGQSEHQRLRKAVLAQMAKRDDVAFKFVVQEPRDLAEVEMIVAAVGIRSDQVWIMPEARTREKLVRGLSELAGPVAERGWALSGRMQTLLWGEVRGR